MQIKRLRILLHTPLGVLLVIHLPCCKNQQLIKNIVQPLSLCVRSSWYYWRSHSVGGDVAGGWEEFSYQSIPILASTCDFFSDHRYLRYLR
ncbi:hypothetical protein PVAG01_01934 [Phlyctema vagabunda]|uniref:Secreted protein n=1 Tax=Phlyctema vagabunda TaxID=108571 RepID=A0ABR4PYH7_9HELO